MPEKLLTVDELDALEHYKIIADEDELKWFYDHCVSPLKRNEAYAFCLSSRHKKLSDDERQGMGLGRSEMLDPTVIIPDANGNIDYARWKKGIREYECHKETFLDKFNRPFLAKTLVLYYHINPCDELKVIKDLKSYINIHEQELIDSAIKTEDRTKALNNLIGEIVSTGSATNTQIERIKMLSTKSDESGVNQSIYKVCKTLSKLKRLQFDNTSTKYWLDFDMDIKKDFRGTKDEERVINLWKKYCYQKLEKGDFVFVKTGGGLHTMIRKEKVRFNPDWFLKEFLYFVNTGVELPDGYIYDKFAIKNPFEKGTPKNYNFCELTKENIYERINKEVWPGWLQSNDKLYCTPCFYIDELVYNEGSQVPLPGTYQYGNCVRVLNKKDFD